MFKIGHFYGHVNYLSTVVKKLNPSSNCLYLSWLYGPKMSHFSNFFNLKTTKSIFHALLCYIPPGYRCAVFLLTAVSWFGSHVQAQQDNLLLVCSFPAFFTNALHFYKMLWFPFLLVIGEEMSGCCDGDFLQRSEEWLCSVAHRLVPKYININPEYLLTLGGQVHKWHILFENTRFNRK